MSIVTGFSWNSLWEYSEAASVWYTAMTRWLGKRWPAIPEHHPIWLVADRLVEAIQAEGCDRFAAWAERVAHAVDDRAVISFQCPRPIPPRDTGESANTWIPLWEAFVRAHRQLLAGGASELQLRSKPLRELFEARANGFWRQLTGQLSLPPNPPQWKVLWTYPVCGGYGLALIEQSCIVMEAILVNPQPELPETVRLAWLLAHELLDRAVPRSVERTPALQWAMRLALIEPVLEAARYVEWVSEHDPPLPSVINWWMDTSLPSVLYEKLQAWWEKAKCHGQFVELLPELETELGQSYDKKNGPVAL